MRIHNVKYFLIDPLEISPVRTTLQLRPRTRLAVRQYYYRMTQEHLRQRFYWFSKRFYRLTFFPLLCKFFGREQIFIVLHAHNNGVHSRS